MMTVETLQVRRRALSGRQMARIRVALADARSGAPGVPHADIVRWVKSWGTGNERRRPRPRKSK
jgi:predicted transcriptional regulator